LVSLELKQQLTAAVQSGSLQTVLINEAGASFATITVPVSENQDMIDRNTVVVVALVVGGKESKKKNELWAYVGGGLGLAIAIGAFVAWKKYYQNKNGKGKARVSPAPTPDISEHTVQAQGTPSDPLEADSENPAVRFVLTGSMAPANKNNNKTLPPLNKSSLPMEVQQPQAGGWRQQAQEEEEGPACLPGTDDAYFGAGGVGAAQEGDLSCLPGPDDAFFPGAAAEPEDRGTTIARVQNLEKMVFGEQAAEEISSGVGMRPSTQPSSGVGMRPSPSTQPSGSSGVGMRPATAAAASGGGGSAWGLKPISPSQHEGQRPATVGGVQHQNSVEEEFLSKSFRNDNSAGGDNFTPQKSAWGLAPVKPGERGKTVERVENLEKAVGWLEDNPPSNFSKF
jgi:hypothetical protein